MCTPQKNLLPGDPTPCYHSDTVVQKLILVTGGAGHVGSHVVEELAKDAQNRIISIDNYSNGSKANHIAGKNIEYRRGDTSSISALVPENPDFVYHLGEYARIAPSFDEPDVVFKLNTVGTQAVVEFCRQRKVQKLIYAASSTKFANEGQGRHQSPYALSKAHNVELIKDYDKWFGLPHAICYFFNAYGPREKGVGVYGTVIAKFEQWYLQGKSLNVVKPGTQKRNFTYVKDLARGLILAGQKGSGDGYALNNVKSYSILEIAQAFGGKVNLVEGRPGRDGAGELPTKARDELGWETTVDILDYIRDFVRNNPR